MLSSGKSPVPPARFVELDGAWDEEECASYGLFHFRHEPTTRTRFPLSASALPEGRRLGPESNNSPNDSGVA